MGLGLLLRLEIIPLFCWAVILIFFGFFLAANDPSPLSDQLKNISLIVFGIVVLIFDLRNRFRKSVDVELIKNPTKRKRKRKVRRKK